MLQGNSLSKFATSMLEQNERTSEQEATPISMTRRPTAAIVYSGTLTKSRIEEKSFDIDEQTNQATRRNAEEWKFHGP